MRVLWASNAPWVGSGYGVQTQQVVTRLQRDGHHVAVASNFGLNGTTLGWQNMPVFSPGLDGYGQDVIPPLYEKWRKGGPEPTVVITLFDVWVYKDPAFDAIPIASWVPVDHLQVPPEVRAFASKHRMIAMSKHGQRAMREAGIEAHYVPHAIDRSVFHPVDATRVREALNIAPDTFVVLINAANKGNMPPRKGWGEMLTAFAAFAQDKRDVLLYLHTDLVGHNGVPLLPLLELRKIRPEQVRISPQPEYRMGDFSSVAVNELYNAAASCGVFLNTSYGEGFGVPALEAQATGLPVILTDATAQRELIGSGWATAWQPYYDLTQGADYAIPLIDSIVANLEAAYAARGDQALRDKAIAFAADYDADLVYDRDWRPVMRSLEQMVTPAPATRQQRRAKARKVR